MKPLLIVLSTLFWIAFAQGPDKNGYRWIDSDTSAGPTFQWIDITGSGTRIELGDDDNQGPFYLGFPFQFYGNVSDSIRICSNGWLSFTSRSHQFHHYPFPDLHEPNALMGLFWADLDPSADGAVYYLADAHRFVVSWVDVPLYGTNDNCTFQAVLDSTGNILFQYLDIPDDFDSCSAGIENEVGLVGLGYFCDGEPVENYVHDSLAIRFYQLDQDVCPICIGRPYEKELAGIGVIPFVKVWNAGKSPASFPATLRIGQQYQEQIIVTDLVPLGDTILEFPAWVPGTDSYQLELFTLLAGDQFPQNDTICSQTFASYLGEMRYDDGVPDTWFLRIGSPTIDWAAAVRFSSPYPEYRLLGARIFVLDTSVFERVLVCPGDSSGPDLDHPYFEAESVAASQPETWLEVPSDTLLSSSGDLWLVAFWPRRAPGPRIGDDQTMPIDKRSYFGSPSIRWISYNDGDIMARLKVDGRTGITELEPAKKLHSLLPNPFRHKLHLSITGCRKQRISGVIYDASGRMVRGFVLQTDREWVWDGTNQKGMPVPQGVYTIVVDGVPINRTKVVKLK